MRGAGRNLAALAVSIAIHGGSAAYAAYGCEYLPVTGDIAVDVEPVEIAAAAPTPQTTEPIPRPDPGPKPEPRLEPRSLDRPRPSASSAPPPPPPALEARPVETAPGGETSVPASEAPADPNAVGGAQGVPGGVPGGTPGGTPGGKEGSVASVKPAPFVGPSYGAAYLHNAPPRYPPVARRMRLEGTATVRVLVGTDGHAERARLVKTSGTQMLDDAALEAVQRWTFVPARQGDTPVAAEVDVPVRFRLEGAGAE